MASSARATTQREKAPRGRAVGRRSLPRGPDHALRRPCRQRFIHRRQQGSVLEIALVNHAIEHIRRVDAMRWKAQLIDDQDVRVEIWGERRRSATLRGRARELPDQFIHADKAGRVAMLNRAVRDRDAEVRFPRAALAAICRRCVSWKSGFCCA